MKICYWKLRQWPLDDWKSYPDICFYQERFSCKDQVSHSVACKTESLSAFSSSLRSFTLYPYVMQDLSVFKLQSQHSCMEFFILWCLNMLIFQCQKASDTSLNDLRHQVWGWVYKINPFLCGYKSYIQALRKYLSFFLLLSTTEKNLNIHVTIE